MPEQPDIILVRLGTLAAALAVHPRRVAQLVNDRIIPKAERGQYDMMKCVPAYIKYLRDRTGDVEMGSQAFAEQRARLTRTRADMAEFEQQKKMGAYVRSDEVKMAWLEIVKIVRMRLLAIPSKLSARILLLKKPAAAQELLQREISEALDGLSKYKITAVPPTNGSAGNGSAKRVRSTAATYRSAVG